MSRCGQCKMLLCWVNLHLDFGLYLSMAVDYNEEDTVAQTDPCSQG